MAANYRGDPHAYGWRLYPATVGGDPFGVGRIGELVKKVKPDLVFTVNDLWIQSQYLEAIFDACPEARVVTYCAVDAGPVDPEWLRNFPRVHAIVVYTEFARREVEQSLLSEDVGRVVVIPHGVDTRCFSPIEDTWVSAATKAKLELEIIESPEQESFVVLNANRNQPRKRIDLTLRGFAEFVRGKPSSVKLLLHMGRVDRGWDVVKLARRLGVEERLIVSGPPDGQCPTVSDEKLNVVYNAADVGLNTSGAEGWGLPAFEHAAAGKAQIVPSHSACSELWEGAAVMLKADNLATQPTTLTDFHFVRPETVAGAIEALYADPQRRQDVARACFEVATRAEYSWDSIAMRWHDLFQTILKRKKTALVPESAA